MSFSAKKVLVELHSLSKNFSNKLLLDKINLSIKSGEITTLIGQNGAGKSTLAKIILKLESYDKGMLKIQDGLRMGYVPQSLDISPKLPLTSECLLKILVNKGSINEIDHFESFIDYGEIQKKDISELSGGQFQKLMLVATLLNKPDLVILDEPTQFLDVISQQEFYAHINYLKKHTGLTVFMISHDLFTVMKNSDQVICLNKHVCCTGKPTEIDKDIDFKNALSEIGLYMHHHDHTH